MVLRLGSRDEATKCRVGRNFIPKTEKTTLPKIRGEDDVNYFFDHDGVMLSKDALSMQHSTNECSNAFSTEFGAFYLLFVDHVIFFSV